MRTFVLILSALCCFGAHAEQIPLSDAQLEKLAQKEPKQYLPLLSKRLDEHMAQSIEKRLKESNNKLKEAILNSQKAWLVFRDADSRLEAMEDEGGSGVAIFVLERRIYQTKLRIYQLDTPFQQGWKAIQ